MSLWDLEFGLYEDVFVIRRSHRNEIEFERPGITMGYDPNVGWDVNVWLRGAGDATRVAEAIRNCGYEQHGLVLWLRGVSSRDLSAREIRRIAVPRIDPA